MSTDTADTHKSDKAVSLLVQAKASVHIRATISLEVCKSQMVHECVCALSVYAACCAWLTCNRACVHAHKCPHTQTALHRAANEGQGLRQKRKREIENERE